MCVRGGPRAEGVGMGGEGVFFLGGGACTRVYVQNLSSEVFFSHSISCLLSR